MTKRDELDELEEQLAAAAATDDDESDETDAAADSGNSSDDDSSEGSSFIHRTLAALTKRRARDPVKAAQQALKAISGHPELNHVTSALVHFIEEQGKKEYPDAEGLAQTSDRRVEKASGLPESLEKTLQELRQAVTRLNEWQAAVDARFAQMDRVAQLAEVEPLAKSSGLRPEALLALQQADPEGFQTLAARLALQKSLFGEIGSALEAPQEHTAIESLFQRAEQIAARDGSNPLEAIPLAARELGFK